MNRLRRAAVAGTFYPERGDLLVAQIDAFLRAAPAPSSTARPPKALIVPHAGYVYSGAVAARGYASLGAAADTIDRVVLFGPAHRVHLQGLALPAATRFCTPLGEVTIDQELAALALALPGVRISEAAHAREHSLEVQLPFLQRLLPRFSLLPVAVGDVRPAELAAVMDALWGGDETLIVVSSDLSHYHSYDEASGIDRASVAHLLEGGPALDHQQACGATAINALSLCARARGMRAELLDMRNSGDTAGDRNRVVGYAALAFYQHIADD